MGLVEPVVLPDPASLGPVHVIAIGGRYGPSGR